MCSESCSYHLHWRHMSNGANLTIASRKLALRIYAGGESPTAAKLSPTPQDYFCVDVDGKIHEDGDEWEIPGNNCVHKQCHNSQVHIMCLECPPSPGKSCKQMMIPGQCCPVWNCLNALPTTTTARKPVIMQPVPAITKIQTTMPLLPTEPSGFCVDVDGKIYEDGYEWEIPGDNCVHKQCHNSQVYFVCLECPPSPGKNCKQVARPGICCPEWDCQDTLVQRLKGNPLLQTVPLTTTVPLATTVPQQPGVCVDGAGVRYRDGEVWMSALDPCMYYSCQGSVILSSAKKCEREEQPDPSCKLVPDPQQCCKIWQCPGCVDSKGRRWDHGRMWEDSQDSCVFFSCIAGNIRRNVEPCSIFPRPHPGCVLHAVKGRCCKEWKC